MFLVAASFFSTRVIAALGTGSGRSLLCSVACASIALSITRPAHSLVGAGVETGIVSRSDKAPSNPGVGFGIGAHAELDPLPLLKIGPYGLVYHLPVGSIVGASFFTIGGRARFVLPVPGNLKPYALAGIGYTHASYSYSGGEVECAAGVKCASSVGSGHFIELPLGVGALYELAPPFQLSLDLTYRPGVSFGGAIFEEGGAHPASGWSLFLGFGVAL